MKKKDFIFSDLEVQGTISVTMLQVNITIVFCTS